MPDVDSPRLIEPALELMRGANDDEWWPSDGEDAACEAIIIP